MASPNKRMSSRHSRASEVFTVCPRPGQLPCDVSHYLAAPSACALVVRVRKLKIPRTPDRRSTPTLRGRFGIRPTRAPAIVAHIPLPPSHPAKIIPAASPRSNQGSDHQGALFPMRGISAACAADNPPRRSATRTGRRLRRSLGGARRRICSPATGPCGSPPTSPTCRSCCGAAYDLTFRATLPAPQGSRRAR